MGRAMSAQRRTEVQATQAWLQQPRARKLQHDQRLLSRMGAVRRGWGRAAESSHKQQVSKPWAAEAQLRNRANQ